MLILSPQKHPQIFDYRLNVTVGSINGVMNTYFTTAILNVYRLLFLLRQEEKKQKQGGI